MRKIKINHDRAECEDCLMNWDRSKGCEAFTDKRKVILNDKGKCIAKRTTHKEMLELEKSLG